MELSFCGLASVLNQAVEGLAHLAGLNMLHLDFKQSNVLLSGIDSSSSSSKFIKDAVGIQVKVADLGLTIRLMPGTTHTEHR